VLLIITNTGDELLGNVNIDDLNDLEPPNRKLEFLVNLSPFRAATHILRVNCAAMAGDTPRQRAYEIFAIECKF